MLELEVVYKQKISKEAVVKTIRDAGFKISNEVPIEHLEEIMQACLENEFKNNKEVTLCTVKVREIENEEEKN